MRGDSAVLTAHRRSHLAVDFAADHIAASEYVWHVRAQEFIHADLPFLAKLNSGFFDADIVGCTGKPTKEIRPSSYLPSMKSPKLKRISYVKAGVLIVDQVKPAILNGTAVRFDLSKGKGIK